MHYDHEPRTRPWVSLRTAFSAAVADIRYAEGDRGIAARLGVLARYAAYLLGMVLFSFAIGALPSTGKLSSQLTLASVTLITASAPAGIVFYPDKRNELVSQARFWIFGVVLFPALVLGALLGVVHLNTPLSSAPHSDQVLVNLARGGIPYLFWATIVVPPFLFIKTIVGLRKLHRDSRDAEDVYSQTQRFNEFYH